MWLYFCFRTKQNAPGVKPPKNVTTAEGKKRVEIPFFLVYFPVLKRLNQHIKLLWFQQQHTNYLLCDDDCDHTGGAVDSPAKPSGSRHLWGLAQRVSPVRPYRFNLWPALEPLTSWTKNTGRIGLSVASESPLWLRDLKKTKKQNLHDHVLFFMEKSIHHYMNEWKCGVWLAFCLQ